MPAVDTIEKHEIGPRRIQPGAHVANQVIGFVEIDAIDRRELKIRIERYVSGKARLPNAHSTGHGQQPPLRRPKPTAGCFQLGVASEERSRR